MEPRGTTEAHHATELSGRFTGKGRIDEAPEGEWKGERAERRYLLFTGGYSTCA